jgi:DNA-binding response OmpR family regulator
MSVFENRSVLVVDDEHELREIIHREFERMKAQVQDAANGKAALELIKKNSFHAVVSDVRMPGGDGVELLKAVKGIDADKPIIILITGFADLTPAQAYHFGADGFIAKPFSLKVLRERVQSALAGPTDQNHSALKSTAKLKIDLTVDSLTTARERKIVAFGRRGFSLMQPPAGLAEDDLIDFHFTTQCKSISPIQTKAIVRWTHDSASPSPNQVGFEFVGLSPAVFGELHSYVNNDKIVASIPLLT